MSEKFIPFQVPATISKISTMANSLRLSVDTQETLSTEAMENLFNLYNQLGWFNFSVHQIEAENVVNLPPLKKTENKSQSQKMRDVIWHMWNQDNNGYAVFNDYYFWYTERIIEKLKEKLA